MTEIETKSGLSRRTVLKGAAWSVPVVAVAVSAPMASASVNPNLDVTVSAYCTGQYNIASLESLLSGMSLVDIPLNLTQLTDVVKAALALTGVHDNARRGFTIGVAGDTLLAGSTFTLATSPQLALVNLELLRDVISAQASFVATVNGGAVTVTTATDIPAGSSFDFNLTEGILDVDALTQTGLSYFPALDTEDPGEGADSAAFTTIVGIPVNLGSLNLGAVLEDVLGTVLAGTVGAILGAVLLPRLNDLDDLRVQLCQ